MNMVPLQQGSAINNRFEIQEVIGQGSFGITYRAWDRLLKRQIALKECFPVSICQREGKRVKPADKEQYEKVRKLILHEARTLASVKHPGVVAVHSAFIDAETDSLFIEMDWLEGSTLAEKMSQGPVSHEQAFEWLHTILCALEKVHEKNITHRDIKPANIVFDGNGVPVLIDFGAALNRELKEGTTMAGPYTPRYAAPEQLYPQLGEIGPWTDFYSLAATWCELLIGECGDGDKRELLSKLDTEYKALLSSVKKNLEGDVKKRFKSARKWVEALNKDIKLPEKTARQLTYSDIQSIIDYVRENYPKSDDKLPDKILLALKMAEFAITPGVQEKVRKLYEIGTIGLGSAGVVSVVAAFGVALGWGQGVVAAITAFIFGGPVLWPVVLGTIGVFAVGSAVYGLFIRKPGDGYAKTLQAMSFAVRKENPRFWKENIHLWR